MTVLFSVGLKHDSNAFTQLDSEEQYSSISSSAFFLLKIFNPVFFFVV